MYMDDPCSTRKPRRRSVGRDAPCVLYVEDNYMLRVATRDVLELVGCRIEEMSNGALVKTWMESNANFALLILDNELEHGDGLELVREVRKIERRKEMPILLLSVDDYAEEARAAGATEFLRKPQNMFELADVVRRLVKNAKLKNVK